REVCEVERTRTNTPLQALVTLNDPVYVEAAIAFANRIMEQNVSRSAEDYINTAYSEATFRSINEETEIILTRLYKESIDYFREEQEELDLYLAQGLMDKSSSDRVSLAALSLVCSAILNLDKFLTKT